MVDRDPDFEALLKYLRDARGFDFTGYKRTTLARRLTKRMSRVGVEGFGRYLDYLEVHPTEFPELFNEVLINVTSFFRDPEAWNYLAAEVLPDLAERATVDTPLRCWCAGVASGQEAYTLAMLVAEAIGTGDFSQRVKIYATDIDENALSEARQATHDAKDLEAVPEEFRKRYLEPLGARHAVRPELRRAIIFGRHDLVQDAPISRLDLLICRNTLMYFTAETQGRILARFHYALDDTGYLFLGKAEMLLTHADLFTPVDLRHHVFRKLPRARPADPFFILPAVNGDPPVEASNQVRLLERATDSLPVAEMVVDDAGRLVFANALARAWFRIGQHDVGRPLQDLEVSYRPIELRSLIDQAYAERREVVVDDVERTVREFEVQYLDVHVTPLFEGAGRLGASVTFSDVTVSNRLRYDVERSRQELETAYEELQSANEEMETTNEELQSTVEELETTNEELQSSNEELETMNEELESTNSELQTINTELHQRTDEVEEGNLFLESVLTSLQLATIVVDRDLRVKLWRGRSQEMWGLRASEVQDQPLGALDIGLPVARVRPLVHASLARPNTPQSAVIEANNRRGRAIRCRVIANALLNEVGAATGVILLIEETAAES